MERLSCGSWSVLNKAESTIPSGREYSLATKHDCNEMAVNTIAIPFKTFIIRLHLKVQHRLRFRRELYSFYLATIGRRCTESELQTLRTPYQSTILPPLRFRLRYFLVLQFR